jgi:tetratricopeptide (TPR) repeat protein
MKKILLYSLLVIPFLAKAQEKEADKNLPQGNEAFVEKKYAEAEAEYRISEFKNQKKAIASYNLGNAIYRQNQANEAKYHFVKALSNAKNKVDKHRIYHNIGNILMKAKDYSGAVEAYKNALRNNPGDDETRYNYALAKKFLKDNPPKKNDDKSKDKKNQKEDQKKNKDQQENKDKDKDKNKDQKDQNNKNQNKDKDQNGNKPQPQPGGVSKQRLQNLLDAVNNEEKKVQDKVNKQKVRANPEKAEKDW